MGEILFIVSIVTLWLAIVFALTWAIAMHMPKTPKWLEWLVAVSIVAALVWLALTPGVQTQCHRKIPLQVDEP